MRGQKKTGVRLKRGQTIVAERERAESESERIQEHQRTKRKHTMSVVIGVLVLVVLGLLAYLTGKNLFEEYDQSVNAPVAEYEIKAQIVDEDRRGQVSKRVREYIALLEQDFRDAGYTVTQVILPTGMSRELYVDLQGMETYFKVNIDRDVAVTVEDAVRMIKYLQEKDIKPVYVDVRIEGKAYYK